MQRLDAPTARVVWRGRQLGVDTRVGFIQGLVLRPHQAVQHTPDFASFRAQINRFPAHRTFAHDLHQAARINGDLGDIRTRRR